MLRHRVEVIDRDLHEAKDLLRRFIDRNPQEWYGDIRAERSRRYRFVTAARKSPLSVPGMRELHMLNQLSSR